jgi:hypothetical protein
VLRRGRTSAAGATDGRDAGDGRAIEKLTTVSMRT